MEKIVIATRSYNRELYRYSQMSINLPYKRYRLVNTSADGYILKLLSLDADWVINIDEDAFVMDGTRIMDLIHYMKDNSIDICGYPDGGIIRIRQHNPLVMNPFFNIMNVKSLREKYAKGIEQDYTTHKIEYEQKTPFELMKCEFKYDFVEPYYPIFLWISQNFNCLYLPAKQHDDGISTIALDHTSYPFLIHTWYSRSYGRDTKHTLRINNVIRETIGEMPKTSFVDSIIDKIDNLSHRLYNKFLLR